MLVDPIKPMLKVAGSKHLNLEYDGLLSSSALSFNLRRCTKGKRTRNNKVGRCRLTVSKPLLKAPMVSALEPTI